MNGGPGLGSSRARSLHEFSPRFWTFLHSLYARARLNGNLELSRPINIFVTHDEQKITTLWMRPRVPPTPPRCVPNDCGILETSKKLATSHMGREVNINLRSGKSAPTILDP